ncbi:MAG: hypothetical protein ACQERC_00180 [Bacteroidota bacterium]
MKQVFLKATLMMAGIFLVSFYSEAQEKKETNYKLRKKVELREPLNLKKVERPVEERSAKQMRKELPKRKAVVYPVKAVQPKKLRLKK